MHRSHEIRHPIIGILSCAELLDTTELTSEQRESAAIMKKAAEDLLSLINDVLEVSERVKYLETVLTHHPSTQRRHLNSGRTPFSRKGTTSAFDDTEQRES